MQMYLRDESAQTILRAATQIEVADQTFHLTQSQHWPYNTRHLPGYPLGCQFLSHWYDSTPKKSQRKQDLNPESSALKADALTTRPMRQSRGENAINVNITLASNLDWHRPALQAACRHTTSLSAWILTMPLPAVSWQLAIMRASPNTIVI